MRSARHLYATVAVLFALSRVLFYALGVRYSASYAWQHFHDVDLLKHRLWESLTHTHAFTPFMNVLAGVVLKVSERHQIAVYHALFTAAGGLLALSLTYVMEEALRVRRCLTLALVALFMCSPSFVYFESFLHYEFLTTAFLAVAAVLFHRALLAERWGPWLAFFSTCALIAFARLTFHLVWVIAVVLLALVCQPKRWRAVLSTALVPVLLVVAMYSNNWVRFGFFGASSRAGFSLALVTLRKLSRPEHRAWVQQGKLHPASILSVYSGADSYAEWVDLGAKRGVPVLDRVHRHNGESNYNHWALIDINQILLRDARTYVSERPWSYLQTVTEGAVDYVRPTSRWHPKDPEGSPHRENRAVIGAWENAFNAMFHEFPVAPLGLYLLMIPLLAYGGWLAGAALWRSGRKGREQEMLVVFLLLQCIYVPLVSCVVAVGELERYRFLVEGFMWAVCAWAGLALWARVRARLSATFARVTAP